MSRKYWSVLAAALLALTLAGCNSSSSDGAGAGAPPPSDPPPSDPPPTAEPSDDLAFGEVSGTAQVPSGWLSPGEAGTPAVLRALDGSRTLSNGDDAPAGLTAVGANVPVHLVMLSDDGQPLEPPLASTVTSETGSYILEFPDGVEPGANLAVQIVVNDQALHGQTVAEEVNVSPVSQYVINKLVEQRARLSTVRPSAVVNLRGVVEGFEFEYEGSTLQDVLESMDANEEARDAAVAAATDAREVGDAALAEALFGDWNYAALELRVGDATWSDYRRGTLETGLGLSQFSLVPAANGEDGELGFLGGAGWWTFWAFDDPVSMGGEVFEPWYGVELWGADDSPVDAEVAADGTLFLFDEAGVDVDGDTAFVRPPQTLRMLPAGDDVFFGVSGTSELLFSADESTGQIDRDEPRGRRVGGELIVFAREGDDPVGAVLDAEYGMIGLQPLAFDNGETELMLHRGEFGPFGVAGSSASGDATLEMWNAHRGPDGRIETNDSPLFGGPNDGVGIGSGSVSVDGDGAVLALDLLIDSEEQAEVEVPGFVSADGSLMVFALADSGEMAEGEGAAEEVGSGLWLSVRLGEPDLAGARYALRTMDLEYNDGGGIRIERITGGELSFRADGSTADVAGLASRYAERIGGGPDVSTGAHPAEDVEGLSFDVSANGRLVAQFDDTTLDGFASANGELIVLMRRYDTVEIHGNDEDVEYEVGAGLWVLTRLHD